MRVFLCSSVRLSLFHRSTEETVLTSRAGRKLIRLFGYCPNFLTGIYLFENNFTGRLPKLSTFRKLQAFNVRENQLSGTIPGGFHKLRELVDLDLRSNRLTGTIPADLGSCTSLQYLYLSENVLEGTIPETLTRLDRLKALPLYGNQLVGRIPGGVGAMTALLDLSLNHNNLTGTLPVDLKDLKQLKALDLAGNSLSGVLLPELGGEAPSPHQTEALHSSAH